MPRTPPNAPKQDVGTVAARDLRDLLTGAGLEWNEAERAILDAACRQAGDIARLEAVLDEQGSTVLGASGQERLSPVFSELRQARVALAKLLDHLAVPDMDGATGVTPSARRAKRAANARWTQVKAAAGD